MAERIASPEKFGGAQASPEYSREPEGSSAERPAREGPKEPAETVPSFSAPQATTTHQPVTGASIMKEVESILADGLDDVYVTLDPMTQREFKEEGERTAQDVSTLLGQAKVQIKKILSLIRQWLQLIPGVSRLFVEQEAKIKTDRLLSLRRRGRGEEA